MKRIWEGTLRSPKESVEVYMQMNGDEKEVWVAREMLNVTTDWYGADKVESRPSSGQREVWVARFFDHSELMIEWYAELDEMKVSYRAMSFNSWGAPASLVEIKKEGQQ